MEIIDLPEEEYVPIYAIVDDKSLIESLYSTKTVKSVSKLIFVSYVKCWRKVRLNQ